MTDSEERTIGRLEAHVQDLRRDVGDIKRDVVDLKNLVQQAKGVRAGLTVMVWMIGAVGGVLSSWGAQALGLFRH